MAIVEFHYVITQLGFSRLERNDLVNWERLVSYISRAWTTIVFQVEFVGSSLRLVRSHWKFDLVIELLCVVYFDLQTIFNSLAIFILLDKIKVLIDFTIVHYDLARTFPDPSLFWYGFIFKDNWNLSIVLANHLKTVSIYCLPCEFSCAIFSFFCHLDFTIR